MKTNEESKLNNSVNNLIIYVAKRTTKYIFDLGNESHSPCNRIEFKGGEWPDKEICQGGLNKAALEKYLIENFRQILGK